VYEGTRQKNRHRGGRVGMGAANNLRSDKTHSTNPPTTPLDANQTQKQREKSLPLLAGEGGVQRRKGGQNQQNFVAHEGN